MKKNAFLHKTHQTKFMLQNSIVFVQNEDKTGYSSFLDVQILQRHEVEAMRKDPQVMERVKKSYELMLDFYGAEMADWSTGTLRCSHIACLVYQPVSPCTWWECTGIHDGLFL
jgi:hypothetical protein